MTVQQIFDLGVKVGIAADPRGVSGVKKYLSREKKEFDEMPEKEKLYFDKDNLVNPFPDSAVHFDDGKTKDVKRVMAGIDIDSSDILLASQLNERGKKIDLVIAHHPVGRALAHLHDVMNMAVGVFESLGIPVHLAEKIMEDRANEVGRGLHPINHYQTVNVAQLLGINFINTHTITDNLVDEFIREYLKNKHPETLGELMDALMELPEYQEATRQGAGPKIFAGSPRHRVGKYVVEMTGGTEPSAKIYQELSRSGVSTVVGMHMRKETLDKASEVQLNVVTAGHMSSDSLGMNLFLDELEKKGIEIVPCGGLIRVSRVKSSKKKK